MPPWRLRDLRRPTTGVARPAAGMNPNRGGCAATAYPRPAPREATGPSLWAQASLRDRYATSLPARP
jgi:hypothetical protein